MEKKFLNAWETWNDYGMNTLWLMNEK